MVKRLINILQLFLVLISMSAYETSAKNFATRKSEILADILLELPNYIEDDQANLAHDLCIASDKHLLSYFKKLPAEKSKRYSSTKAYSKGATCRYIFIDNKQGARELLRTTANQAILISNYASFIEEGGPIAIVDLNGRVGIYLNLTAIKMAKAKFNPDLIELSKRAIQ